MAYIINPDGTITTVPPEYDRNGTLSIKRGYNLNEESDPNEDVSKPALPNGRRRKQIFIVKKKVGKTSTQSTSSPKKESKTIVLGESPSTSYEGWASFQPVRRRKKRKTFTSPASGIRLESIAEIEKFFSNRIANRKGLTHEEFKRIRATLNVNLANYFTSCYMDSFAALSATVKSSEKSAKKRNKKKKAKQMQTMGTASSPSPEVPSCPPGRKPKYGYARDRFGRVQERDSFNEEKRNEFHQASNSQRQYDYSSYDANDDNDGAYSNWK